MRKPFIPRNAEKFAFAEKLFIEGVAQEEIARRVGVTAVTISNWKDRGGWADKRAAHLLSPQVMMHKLMQRMTDMLDKEQEFNADAFSKVAKQLRELQKDVGIDETIQVFMAFGSWLESYAAGDPSVDEELIRKITTLQDSYVEKRMNDIKNGTL